MSIPAFADIGLFFAVLLTALTLPGTLLLLVLSIAGLLPVRRSASPMASGRIAVLVPAHNEAGGIALTIANLRAETALDGASDLIVVADNCTDTTAQIASGLGVRTLERHDAARRGKGFALDFAFSQLLAQDYAYFVVVDADSRLDPGFLGHFRRQFGAGAMVLQARYLVLNAESSMRTRLMALALAAFNVLRPRGRAAMGCSAGLLGNGFGLRREVLERIPYSAGSVVEDLEYHLVLVWHGMRVGFADEAVVRGEMPSATAGARNQRTRWEGGRLHILRTHAPGLLKDFLSGRTNALEPLLDLLLLPLSYHVLLLAGLLALPVAWAPVVGLASLGVVLFHIVAATKVAGLRWRDLHVLLAVPFYLLWKICLLPATLANAGRNAPWVRTAREKSE